jgi:hypothetical protein
MSLLNPSEIRVFGSTSATQLQIFDVPTFSREYAYLNTATFNIMSALPDGIGGLRVLFMVSFVR